MATLFKRDGRYYVQYMINGRRVRKVIGSDKKEAEIYLNEIKYRLFKGDIKPSKPKIPIDLLINRYMTNCTNRIAGSTQIRYRNALRYFVEFVGKCHPIQFTDQISKIMMTEYVDFRLSHTPKPRSNTINQELTIIRAMLNFAVDSEYIQKNPFRRVKMLKTNDAKKGIIIQPEEINSLLGGCESLVDGSWFRDILLVFLNTGMRLGELLNLTSDDIDLKENVIKIQEKSFWSPKTYERDIPMNQLTNEIITRHMDYRTILVFTHRDKKIEANKLRKKLITLSRRVGLPHITRIHDFRHTFASNLLMKGVDIPTVQALLGHRSWNTTMIYSHQTNEHKSKAVGML